MVENSDTQGTSQITTMKSEDLPTSKEPGTHSTQIIKTAVLFIVITDTDHNENNTSDSQKFVTGMEQQKYAW